MPGAPSAIMLPQLASGGLMPIPRNDNDASSRSTFPTPSAADTMMGAAAFGRTWRKITRPSSAPSARAAATKSRCRRDRTSARTSRLVRAEVLSLRQRDFVAAARALGADDGRVIFRHVLPNAAAPIIVSAALGVGNVLLLEASLSFLGISIKPPDPTWGNMIADNAPSIYTAPWSTVVPGLAISLVVMSLNAVADGVQDALDPHEREPA